MIDQILYRNIEGLLASYGTIQRVEYQEGPDAPTQYWIGSHYPISSTAPAGVVRRYAPLLHPDSMIVPFMPSQFLLYFKEAGFTQIRCTTHMHTPWFANPHDSYTLLLPGHRTHMWLATWPVYLMELPVWIHLCTVSRPPHRSIFTTT